MKHKWITALAALACMAGASLAATSVNLEFNGSGNTLEATGFDDVYNLNPPTFTVGGGALTITTTDTDIYGQYENNPNNGKNVFYSVIDPQYKTVLDTKVTYNNLNHNYQGGGIWIGTDEDHYVRLGVVNVDTNIRTEFIRENVDLWNNPAGGYNGPGGDIKNTGGPNITASPLTQSLTVYLRIVREGRSASGYYSLDGTNYTFIATWTDVATGPTPDYPHIPADATCKVGVYAFGNAGPPDDPRYRGDATAAFDYLHAVSSQAERPLVEITTANNYNWYVKSGIGDPSWAGTALDERTDASWTARPVPDPDWATGPVNPGTHAYGWYRMHFTTPPNLLSIPGRQITLHVLPKGGEAIGDVDATYVNGVLVGTTGSFPFTDTTPGPTTNADGKANYYPGAAPVYFQQRDYTFPASLLKSGNDANVIAIKVYNRSGNGGLVGIPQLQVAIPSATVSGTVTAAGAPVADARVSAMDREGLVSQSVLTGSDGKFTLVGIPTGDTVIGMAKPGILPATREVGSLADGQTISNLAISTTAVAGEAPAPFYDDFSDGPEGWRSKWVAISLVAPALSANEGDANNPFIQEPGYDVNLGTPYDPSLLMTSGNAQRGGILSTKRFSKYASVNSARLISASPFDNGGNVPNVILQLNGAEQDDPTQMPGYGSYKYIEFDIEGTVHALGADGSDLGKRLQWIVWIQGIDPVRGVFPFAMPDITSVTGDNPLDLTIARTGSYYDFYLNGTRIHSFNTFDGGLPNHKIDLYSYPSGAQQVWKWVRAADATVAPPPDTTKVVKALRIAGGLDAATGADMTSLNVSGDDNKITVGDAVKLLQTAVNP